MTYCSSPFVSRKNKDQVDFRVPLRVFVHMQQNPLPQPEDGSLNPAAALLARYMDLCEKHRQLAEEKKQERRENRYYPFFCPTLARVTCTHHKGSSVLLTRIFIAI